MKKYIKAYLPFTALLGLIIFWPKIKLVPNAFAQEAVVDAAAGALLLEQNAQLAEMAGVQAGMNAQQKMIENIKKATGYIKDAKAIYDLASAMADMICMYDRIDAIYQKSGAKNVCGFSAEYKMSMLNIQAATDIISLILKGGLNMDQGLRVANLKNAVELLGKGNAQLVKFHSVLMDAQNRNISAENTKKSLLVSSIIYQY